MARHRDNNRCQHPRQHRRSDHVKSLELRRGGYVTGLLSHSTFITACLALPNLVNHEEEDDMGAQQRHQGCMIYSPPSTGGALL